jgi:hypothetical protein
VRAGKNRGRPVSLMDVAIYCHRFANLLIALHATDGNRNIVDHAEAFAVIGKRVMESSSDADGHAVDEGMIGGQHRSASGEPEGAYQLRRVRDFELQLFARAERARPQLLNVARGVHQKYVFVGGRPRGDEVRCGGNSRRDQPVVNALVLFGGENVRPDGQVVVIAVDEFEGKHSGLSIRHSAGRVRKTPYHTRFQESCSDGRTVLRQRVLAIEST